MLGKQLKLLRETAGKSQLEVCSALNIEQSTLEIMRTTRGSKVRNPH